MQPALATQRLSLIPVSGEEVAFVRLAMGLLGGEASDIWRRTAETILHEHLDPLSMTALWRIAAENDANTGLIGLATPGVAVGSLRAIGWRSLELVVAVTPWNRRVGLAAEAIDAVVEHALSDGVTFAVLSAVAVGNDGGHALMHRCRFEALGRITEISREFVVYERAG